MRPQQLRILFFGLFRQYANQRLVRLKYLDVPPPWDDPLERVSATDLWGLSDEALLRIEQSQTGPVKLFGEDSLLLDDERSVWLAEHTRLGDLFFSDREFSFFDRMFRGFLSESGAVSGSLQPQSSLGEGLCVRDYLSRVGPADSPDTGTRSGAELVNEGN